jgi:hypothetical protein
VCSARVSPWACVRGGGVSDPDGSAVLHQQHFVAVDGGRELIVTHCQDFLELPECSSGVSVATLVADQVPPRIKRGGVLCSQCPREVRDERQRFLDSCSGVAGLGQPASQPGFGGCGGCSWHQGRGFAAGRRRERSRTRMTGCGHAWPRYGGGWRRPSRNRTRPRRRSMRRASPRSFHLRPGLLQPAADRLLVTFDGSPRRDLAGETVPDQQLAHPLQGAALVEPGELGLTLAPARPNPPTGPPFSQARHRCTGRALTRNSFAITALGPRAANRSAALNLIPSRNCRRPSDRPPSPRAYLMTDGVPPGSSSVSR